MRTVNHSFGSPKSSIKEKAGSNDPKRTGYKQEFPISNKGY